MKKWKAFLINRENEINEKSPVFQSRYFKENFTIQLIEEIY
jgi:hypothetical protein